MVLKLKGATAMSIILGTLLKLTASTGKFSIESVTDSTEHQLSIIDDFLPTEPFTSSKDLKANIKAQRDELLKHVTEEPTCFEYTEVEDVTSAEVKKFLTGNKQWTLMYATGFDEDLYWFKGCINPDLELTTDNIVVSDDTAVVDLLKKVCTSVQQINKKSYLVVANRKMVKVALEPFMVLRRTGATSEHYFQQEPHHTELFIRTALQHLTT